MADLFPYLKLWATVVEVAVKDFLYGDEEKHRLAAQWIFDNNIDIAFNTFDNLCYTLDLDPDAVRDRILSEIT